MNILLIYPEFPDTFWSFKHAIKFIRKKAALPPLGLLTVGAMLPETWSKKLIDMNVRDIKEKDLKWADAVFISAMVVQRQSTLKTIARCNKAGITVIAGGPLFTSDYKSIKGVDHFVLNEAELTLPAFLADFEQGAAKKLYASENFCDIQNTPTPLWSLINPNDYASLSIQFSRGCPFDCDFCNVTALFGHRARLKTVKQIITELDVMYELGWRGQVFFVDDNFIGNKRFLKTSLLPALIQWRHDKKGIPFYTEASVNLADDENLMDLMVQAGFDAVFVGIESVDDQSLTECNKVQNKNRDLLKCIKKIQRSGLQVMGGFIVGFDSDTASIFQRQIDFIQKSGIVTAMVGLLQAPPGTKLYERMKEEGRLRGILSGDNVDGSTNIIPKMDLEQLKEGYRRIMLHLYNPKHYYQRVKTFLMEYRPPQITIPFDRQRVLAIFRSSIRLGIIGRERFQFWKLLIWTTFFRPSLIPLAFTFAINGYHFRHVSKNLAR